MSLNKKKMVREIGRRTRLKNHEVQTVIETLIELWIEELVASGRIEIENFLILEYKDKVYGLMSTDGESRVVSKRKIKVGISK